MMNKADAGRANTTSGILTRALRAAAVFVALAASMLPATCWGLASNNVQLDSPIYEYIDKLNGFGLIDSDVHGLKPYSKSEAARLVIEAEGNYKKLGADAPELAGEVISRLHFLLPRELDLYPQEDVTPTIDWNPVSSVRLRYVYLEGDPRSYERFVPDLGGEGLFGIGNIRLTFPKGHVLRSGGNEGTPLFENNEGVIYKKHNNLELKTEVELYLTQYVTALLQPLALASDISSDTQKTHTELGLNKGYVKLGGKGVELEFGRDANWFGQGYRGATILSNNAKNLTELKISSPEPVDWPWLKRNVGLFKYSIVASRLDPSGKGDALRQPWYAAVKLSIKTTPNFEMGLSYARQQGGPNVHVQPGLGGVFSVGDGQGSNSLGGIDLRYRLPWAFLRGTTVYWEYFGEDSAVVVPIVESHIVGVYVPRLTRDGRNDLRVELYFGNKLAYTDFKFPAGYTNDALIMGHSQGGDTRDYYTKLTHYFSVRNTLAFEYFHTQRGRLGRIGKEAVEDTDAARLTWNLPISREWDARLGYGFEHVQNFNLKDGIDRDNHLARLDVTYRF